MGFSGEGAVAGGSSGAATGYSMGGPKGAAAGALIGGVAGGFMNKKKETGFSKGDLEAFYSQRSNQIHSFGTQLANMRAKYAAQLPQFQNHVVGQFGANLESNFGAKGLSVGGGAFQSTLARKAADIYQQGQMDLFGMERADAMYLDSQQGAASASRFGAAAGNQGEAGYPFMSGLANIAGQVGTAYAINKAGGQGPVGWDGGGPSTKARKPLFVHD